MRFPLFCLIFYFSILAFVCKSQIIVHDAFQYELRFHDVNGTETKRNTIIQKIKIFYSGYCVEAKSNAMLIDIYSTSDQKETLLLDLTEHKKENKNTYFYAKLNDCEKNSIFFSPNETIVILITTNKIAIGFLNVDLYIKNYITSVEY